MKFLLVAPKQVGKGRSYGFPLGIAYISSSLKQAGYEVQCINMNHTDEPAEAVIGRAVAAFDPDVCGSGSTSLYHQQVKDIFDAARKAKPSIVNVAGGGLVSSAPAIALKLVNADIGVIGEGEHTIVDVAEALRSGSDLATVQGIVFDDGNGTYAQTEKRTANKDLDSLPWPDYEGFAVEKLFDAQRPSDEPFFHITDDPRCISMISSRSCPFACTFCFHPNGRVYRERSLDDFFAELDHVIERYNINLIDIFDELFAVKKARLLEFCERIRPYAINWTCQLHVSVVDEEVMDLLKGSGCSYISYGLESANDDVLLSMKKKTTRAQYDRVLAITYDKKVGIQGNFIFGDPAETLETANDTMDWWANNREYEINLSILQAYPGSEVYEHGVREGLIDRHKDYLPQGIINVTNMTDAEANILNNRVSVYRESLVRPAKILAYDAQPEPDPHRGDLYTVRWECPRCGHHNTFANLTNDVTHNYQYYTLACRSCFSRSSVENRARKIWVDNAASGLLNEGLALKQACRYEDAAAKFTEVMGLPFPQLGYDKPDAYVHAATELGNMWLHLRKAPREAILFHGFALKHRAYDPRYHMLYAVSLASAGCAHAAKLHIDTARRLADAADGETLAAVENLAASIDEAVRQEREPRYFN